MFKENKRGKRKILGKIAENNDRIKRKYDYKIKTMYHNIIQAKVPLKKFIKENGGQNYCHCIGTESQILSMLS